MALILSGWLCRSAPSGSPVVATSLRVASPGRDWVLLGGVA